MQDKKFLGAKNITFVTFLKTKRALIACISVVMGTICMMFYLTIYSAYLQDEVKVDKSLVGFIFGI